MPPLWRIFKLCPLYGGSLNYAPFMVIFVSSLDGIIWSKSSLAAAGGLNTFISCGLAGQVITTDHLLNKLMAINN